MTRRTQLLFFTLAMPLACGNAEPAGGQPVDTLDTAEPAAPPISGGTLLVTRDGLRAVASDPDLDRVAIVAIGAAPELLADVQLSRGEEPGRLAEDRDGRVHAVLRRGGAIATLDLESGAALARRPVCVSPRGIAYDESADLLHVACASGELVSLSPASGEVSRRLQLDADLRDVVVVPGGLVVSRFKSASLVRLDQQGNVVARIAPKAIERGPQDLSQPANDPLESAVAWRTVTTSSGGVFMLHQYAVARPLELGENASVPAAPYRAEGSNCGGVVTPAVSTLGPTGELEMGLPLPALALSVDVAASSDEKWLAVAHAGAKDDKVTLYHSEELPTLGRSPVGCASPAGRVIVVGQPVAVAMLPGRVPATIAESEWLVVQTRNPRRLAFYSGFSAPRASVDLEGPADGVGNFIFHVDAGSGIACAQCHPEGGEDGRVWKFQPIGPRRTQALNAGLSGTAPYRWSGELASIEDLLSDVFVRRMGLTRPPASNLGHLSRWLESLRPPIPMVDSDSDAAVRGRSLFESSQVGCTECHAGPNVAKSSNVDVGPEPGQAFQVPALRGVGYRAPFMHDGCAPTLRARFDQACGGGDRHGKTSQLSEEQIADLIAYLESL
jgi:hypothetical protein